MVICLAFTQRPFNYSNFVLKRARALQRLCILCVVVTKKVKISWKKNATTEAPEKLTETESRKRDYGTNSFFRPSKGE